MQPADNNTPTPVIAPTPAPQPEKKLGFFARLFGKKSLAPASVVPPHESHTPPPRLDDVPQSDSAVPAPVATPVAEVAAVPVEPVTPVVPEVTAPAEPVAEPVVATPVVGGPAPVQPVTPVTPGVTPTQTPPTTPLV